MPSIHVGIAWLAYVLVRHRFGSRNGLAWIALGFALTIWFASVHLGWHYFTDGLVSIVAVSLLWWLTGRYLDVLERLAEKSKVRFRLQKPAFRKVRAA